MIINFILPGVGQSGGVKMAFMYAQYLTEQGHDVVCYYPLTGAYFGYKKILFQKMIYKQLTDATLKADWFPHTFSIEHPLWIHNMSVRDADVTIATSWLTAYWVNRLLKEKGKKCYFIQGYETWGNVRQNNAVIKSYNLKFDERITVSSALQNRLKDENNVSSKVICNGIPQEETRQRKKENCNVDIVVGFPYRTSENKNCTMAIKLLSEIERKYEVCIKSYGFTKPKGWKTEWFFLENPTRNELVEFYESVDIFYVPSLYEGWGLPAMEAMAQGCAVVAHNSGVIAEIGKDEENCIILRDASDYGETITKISKLISNRKMILEIGENARQEIVNKYTHEKSCALFEEILTNMMT